MLPFLLSIITCSQLYLVSVITRSSLLVLSCDIAFLVSGDPVIILMSEPVLISSKLECIGVGQRRGGHLLCEQWRHKCTHNRQPPPQHHEQLFQSRRGRSSRHWVPRKSRYTHVTSTCYAPVTYSRTCLTVFTHGDGSVLIWRDFLLYLLTIQFLFNIAINYFLSNDWLTLEFLQRFILDLISPQKVFCR